MSPSRSKLYSARALLAETDRELAQAFFETQSPEVRATWKRIREAMSLLDEALDLETQRKAKLG